MESKICCQCCQEKSLNDFKQIKNTNRYKSLCVICEKEYMKKYRETNKEKIKSQKKEWYVKNIDVNTTKRKINYQNNKETLKIKSKTYSITNKEKIKQNKKEYYFKNKPKIIKQHGEYNKIKKKLNPLFKLSSNIRNIIYFSLKRNKLQKNDKTTVILGCSYKEFKQHLETKFESWMNWDNYGNPKDGVIEPNKTWDIDHIIPISTANTIEDVLKLNHYTNLQPLCSYVNRIIKKNK